MTSYNFGDIVLRKAIYYKEVRDIRGKRYRGTQVNSKKNVPPVILSFLKIEEDFGNPKIHKILISRRNLPHEFVKMFRGHFTPPKNSNALAA